MSRVERHLVFFVFRIRKMTHSKYQDLLCKPATRMANIAPFYVMDLLGRAKALEVQGREIIHMEIGEPDFPTPEPIVEAGMQALAAGRTKYTASLGFPELREAIAGFYRQRYGVDISPRRIAITPGASGALQLALGVLVDPGDEVLITDPGYPCNRNMIRLFGGNPINVPVEPDTAYQLTSELVSRHMTPATTAIMLTSPSNPTGTLVSSRDMADILEQAGGKNAAPIPRATNTPISNRQQSIGFAGKNHRRYSRGATLVVDEIYLGLVYGANVRDTPDTDAADIHSTVYAHTVDTALALSDEVFVVGGFSKYFGMTGWRLGWLVAPEAFMREIEKLAQNLYLSAPTVAQYAALAAFRPETLAILEARRREFQQRRDFLLPALQSLGFDFPVKPQGAFYLYADCGRFTQNSLSFALDLLENTGVAITPGLDFGKNASGRHVRFAYTTCMENLHRGVERLGHYLFPQRSGGG
uniref:Aminotransferase n=1 Tax=Candidatus Kentrum eta TaxID=2126337 RepID=A0A450UYJ3_9GAMM|nr:MAG: Aspartate/methionine/tyrosine aminotransferase [Candidatus Kentron sp. H]VFJ97932.1 MAG: Aspartate/methionine/tyrosine aminotransferase [Candidatus Kentron sp. H]VFK03437.1 MAG: Aspartate/methionine/tyrosine aminotransferase [Candidatus Kentron sp. H]